MYYITQQFENNILQIVPKITMGKYFFLHGTFAGATIHKSQSHKNQNKLVSDVDIEDFIPISEDLQQKVINHITELEKQNPNIHFTKCLFGYNDLILDYTLERNGSISFDKEKYIKILQKSNLESDKKEQLITECKIMKTNKDFFLFREKMQSYWQLEWTLNELRNKSNAFSKFLKKSPYSNPLILQYIYEFEKDKYISIDDSGLLYESDKLNKRYIPKNRMITLKEYTKFRDNIELLNEFKRTQTNKWIYEAIFKNLAQEKYYKTLKRIKTLFAHMLFQNFENKVSKNKSKKLFELRKEIMKIIDTPPLPQLNQLKNRQQILEEFPEVSDKFKKELQQELKAIQTHINNTKKNNNIKKNHENITKINISNLLNELAKPIYETYVSQIDEFTMFNLKTVMKLPIIQTPSSTT